jgi:hypothetical protein
MLLCSSSFLIGKFAYALVDLEPMTSPSTLLSINHKDCKVLNLRIILLQLHHSFIISIITGMICNREGKRVEEVGYQPHHNYTMYVPN